MSSGLRASQGTLLEMYDALMVDLDGVVYRGEQPIEHASDALARAESEGVKCAYVTNNASRTPEQVADLLTRVGVRADAHDVVTSSQAGARVVAELVPPGSSVLAIGGDGVARALLERGFRVVTSARERPAAVLQGYGPDVSWRELSEGAYAVVAGAHYVATNLDRTFPTPQGRAPGNGSLVAVITTATGVSPVSAGKPESPLMLESIDRVRSLRPLVVGDRLDTDIEAAARLDLPSLLVLTGVTHLDDLLLAPSHSRPSYVGDDLRTLAEEHPVVEQRGGGVQCRGARVEISGGELRITEASGPTIDVVRAAAVASWHAADSGQPIDARAAAALIGQTRTESEHGGTDRDSV